MFVFVCLNLVLENFHNSGQAQGAKKESACLCLKMLVQDVTKFWQKHEIIFFADLFFIACVKKTFLIHNRLALKRAKRLARKRKSMQLDISLGSVMADLELSSDSDSEDERASKSFAYPIMIINNGVFKKSYD